jgi:hypothetical protein
MVPLPQFILINVLLDALVPLHVNGMLVTQLFVLTDHCVKELQNALGISNLLTAVACHAQVMDHIVYV